MSSRPKKPREWIEALICAAFDRARTPRSNEYKAGVRALLEQRFTKKPLACPYPLGTAQADAFFAGTDEGCLIWSEHVQEQAAAA